MIRLLLVMTLLLGAGAGIGARATETSDRPVLRPGTTANGQFIPRADDAGSITTSIRRADVQPPASKAPDVQVSLAPKMRPQSVVRAARKQRTLLAQGAICGSVDIQGEVIGRVTSPTNGCGIADAVRVRSVSGISLGPSAIMDCGTAQKLDLWVEKSAIPRLRKIGGGLKALRVIGHYSCRTRNNRAGARISEHGKGRAIDIAGFRLRDGTSVTVLKDWNSGRSGKALKQMHREACGPFGTVLGPNSDRFHQDHFHFDTARHGNGPYCR